jgi:clan AA aspartic protease (TIGR02281 family)
MHLFGACRLNIRLLASLGCAFTLGWILSWMYYDASTTIANSDPAGSTALPQTSNAASQSSSHANAENALRQPDKANQAVTSASVLDVMLGRLQRGEFEAVMAQYPVLQSTLSESDATEHRRIILDHARSLLESGQPVIAYALLSLYLKYEYRDISALLLMAEIHRAAGNDMEAIEVLFQARSYAYTAESIEQTGNAIRSMVRDYSAQLLARKDYIAQLSLYKRLTELEPEYTLHFIRLAETYLALGNVVDARKALALTEHDSSVLELANDINRRIETEMAADKQYAAEVSLQAFGNQYLVNAVLNNAQSAVLLLDTGASLSIISPELLRLLGIPYQSTGGNAWFSTAGGRIRAPVITLDSLAIDGVVVENIEVGIIGEFDNNPFDGLLGMNFLRHFEFFIDQGERKLQLSPN